MNRQIEFKIWDKLEKKFITLDDLQKLRAIGIQNNGTLFLDPHYNFVSNMMLQKDTFIFCQFTGLYDCNNQKIFESDYLKCEGLEMIVRWDEFSAGFCFEDDSGKQIDVTRDNSNNFEIIGNKYENRN